MLTLLECITAALQKYSTHYSINGYCIAYSGGVDSHVLLHALALLRKTHIGLALRAVHINHGLMEDATKWAQHCTKICHDLGVNCEVIKVAVLAKNGESLEAQARDARYTALRNNIGAQECLLTAQHMDDQAETLLLQLFRGCGPQGLASMPNIAPFGQGTIARPMLSITRESILDYAQGNHLAWIEDNSNRDITHSRNYLRHEIIPKLKQRWPALNKTLARSAELCAEAAQIVEDDIFADFKNIRSNKNTLSVSALNKFDLIKRKNIIRFWLKSSGFPLPSHAALEQVLDSVLNAAHDAQPLVRWRGCEIRRFQDNIYVMLPLPNHDISTCLAWDCKTPINSQIFGTISTSKVKGLGIKSSLVSTYPITIEFRKGGEVFRNGLNPQTKSLKKYFQEIAIPPWLRDRIPLIYIDNQIAAIASYVICEAYQAAEDEIGYQVHWQPSWEF